MRLNIAIGEEVNALCADSSFIDSWQKTWSSCEWATVFQSPEFAMVWFDSYERSFEPVLIFDDQAGKLEFLLVLARNRSTGELVHVGAHHAEYQAWLSSRSTVECLIALIDLLKTRSLMKLRLKYLPPRFPVGELNSSRLLEAARVHSYDRPWIKVGDGDSFRSQLNKKDYRYRLRKIEEAGTLHFKRITSLEEFDRWSADIVACTDLRQGAVNATLPFVADPCKLDFHRRMLARGGILDVTVLLAGTRFVSAHANWVDRHGPILGLLTHSPFFAKQSPGAIHLFNTSILASEDGYSELDLTPGAGYKDRFATDRDQVSDLDIDLHRFRRATRSAFNRLIALMKGNIKHSPVLAGLVNQLLARHRSVSKLGGLPGLLWRRLASWVRSDVELLVYAIALNSRTDATVEPSVKRDALADLLLDQGNRYPNNQQSAVLKDYLLRLERGEHSYSIRGSDDVLAHIGWCVENQRQGSLSEVDLFLRVPENSVVFYDFYTHPSHRGKGLYRKNLETMLFEAQQKGFSQAIITVSSDNWTSRKVIERVGFEFAASGTRSIRMGRVVRSISTTKGRENLLSRESLSSEH